MLAILDPLTGVLLGLLVLVGLVALLVPERGLLARARRLREFRHRVHREDALKHTYDRELNGGPATMLSVAGVLQVPVSRAAEVVAGLQRGEWLQVSGEEVRLTDAGRSYALNVLRAHRLWEQHLAEHTGFAESQWHHLADVEEHRISPERVERLAAELGYPPFDPHGDPIPTAAGEIAPGDTRPLASLHVDGWGRVRHVEDEPESVCAQIRAIGLYPGTVLRLLESSARRVRIWVEGEEHVLAPVVAASVSVSPLEPTPPAPAGGATEPLSLLTPGRVATVSRLLPACRGAERRRLLDFGILPGTRIEVALESPTGNLRAYRVRDTLIALRAEQAGMILIGREEGVHAG